jgi:hypothetical protein
MAVSNRIKQSKKKKSVKIERLSGFKERFLVIHDELGGNAVIWITLADLKRLVEEYAHPVVR